MRAGGQFVVYAKITDPGGTGVASAVADVSALAAGATSVVLTPCLTSCTIGATTYTWSSAPVTADAGLAQGTKSFTVSGTDNASNTGAPTPFSVRPDNTNPTASAGVIVASATSAVSATSARAAPMWSTRARPTPVRPRAASPTVTADVSALNAGVTALSAPGVHVELHDRRRHLRVQERGDHRRGRPSRRERSRSRVTATDKAGQHRARSASPATVAQHRPDGERGHRAHQRLDDAGLRQVGGRTYLVYADAVDGGAATASPPGRRPTSAA